MSSSGTSGPNGGRALAEALAHLDSPMVIVTCGTGAGPRVERGGCLVGFATQCSIDPPRYLACISKANHTHDLAAGAEVLAVHLLDEADRGLAEVFGELTGDLVDKLALVPWTAGPGGAPVLDDAAAWFAGRVLDRIDLGDHTGHVLEPVAGEVRRWTGQLGYQAVRRLRAGHPASG